MLFLIRLAWEASEVHFFHRICSEPLKPLLSVLGSEFGSAWLGARPGRAPDRCLARLRARFASRLEDSTRGLDST